MARLRQAGSEPRTRNKPRRPDKRRGADAPHAAESSRKTEILHETDSPRKAAAATTPDGQNIDPPATPYDLESSLGFLVYKVHQHAAADLRHALEPTGLTPPQFGVLALLHEHDDQRQAALCERGAIDPNTMVGIVDRLEAAGLVARRRDPSDRRAYLVGITPKGRRTFTDCLPLRNQAASHSWAALSAAQQEALGSLLRKALRLPEPGTLDA